jgi:hypothetical protein
MQIIALEVNVFTREPSKIGYERAYLQLRRYIMTKLILFILLSATTTPSVQAGDANASRQDAMDFCNQFVIRDPDPGVRLGNRLDCYLDDWDDSWGTPWR